MSTTPAPRPATAPLESGHRLRVLWWGLFFLAAVTLLLSGTLTFQRFQDQAQAASRQRQLSSQLATLSTQLTEVELEAWAFLGTNNPADAAGFLQRRKAVESALTPLRAPSDAAPEHRERLGQFPQAARAYLSHLERGVALQGQSQPREAVNLLTRSRLEGAALREKLAALQLDAEARQRLREDRRIGLLSEAAVVGLLLLLVLLGAYFLVRLERAQLQSRERQLVRENKQLRALTEEDGLTGLKNRRAFDNRLRAEWRRARRYNIPLSVLVLDVDFFKKYNDAFGHPAGDEILRRVAGLLAQTARLTDTIARYGGEEFVILLPHAEAAESKIVGERLRRLFEDASWPHREITASIGLATINDTIKDADELVRAADAALYFAKESGRNRVMHWEQLQKNSSHGTRELLA